MLETKGIMKTMCKAPLYSGLEKSLILMLAIAAKMKIKTSLTNVPFAIILPM
jgi:hypothetical protein